MLSYNICFVRKGNDVLLLNREHPSWMGRWNGVGGKLERGEDPRESAVRELYEETQITGCDLTFKGFITWNVDGSKYGGMYTYLADVPADYAYSTPIKTNEGILDWKSIDWILHPDNQGIASNIPPCLEKILYDPSCYNHHFMYEDGHLSGQYSELLNPMVEFDAAIRYEYLNHCRMASEYAI